MRIPAFVGRLLDQLKSQRFRDGYVLAPRNREEFLVTLPNGDIVVAYVFVAGPECDFDRVIVKESLERSINEKAISPSDQAEIIRKLGSFSHFRGQTIGLQESRSEPPIPLDRSAPA